MAYNAIVQVDNLGAGRWSVQIAETEAGAATEAVVTGLPVDLRLLKQVSSLVSGTGTTVDPILGTATNPSGVNVIAENDTPAVDVNNVASPPIPFVAATGAVYHRSICDAGSDNVVQSVYLFAEHWV